MKTKKIVVTRHASLVQLLYDRGVISRDEEIEILPHVDDVEQVSDKHVIGVLPLHLASVARCITEIPLVGLKPEDRGKELSYERLKEVAGPTRHYFVRELAPKNLTPAELAECWDGALYNS